MSKDFIVKHRPVLIRWLCRLSLATMAALFAYVVTRPSYNFAHWVPHNFLRRIGFDYSTLLWAEQNADIALHFGGAFILTLLLRGSALPIISAPRIRPFIIVCGLCLAAEIAQHLIGRGIETSDLLLGICGSFMAYLAKDNKH